MLMLTHPSLDVENHYINLCDHQFKGACLMYTIVRDLIFSPLYLDIWTVLKVRYVLFIQSFNKIIFQLYHAGPFHLWMILLTKDTRKFISKFHNVKMDRVQRMLKNYIDHFKCSPLYLRSSSPSTHPK